MIIDKLGHIIRLANLALNWIGTFKAFEMNISKIF